jgi:polyphosphate kinase
MPIKKIESIQREISWLHFNARVLQEAIDPANPLIERLRFLGIFSNNRDEFFRVRVATLRRLKAFGKEKNENLGYDPSKVLKEVKKLIEEQEIVFTEAYFRIVQELRETGISIIGLEEMSADQGAYVKQYFRDKVHPNLFPIMLSELKDANSLKDNSIYLAVVLKQSPAPLSRNYALIKVPTSSVSRFLILPRTDDKHDILLLDDVIRYNLGDIFLPFGYDLYEAYAMKFTRDAEMDIDNDVSKSFIEIMSESLKQRKRGVPVRFVYDKTMPDILLNLLLKKFRINKDDALRGGGRYHNFRDFMGFPSVGSKDLYFVPQPPLRHPDLPMNKSIFSVIRKKDLLLHFPYQSFIHIIDLLREASIDPQVRSIKMTLYRTASNSNVINALINAARNGKSVTVFLELQARFDEQANIMWSEKLREEGVKIIKSIPGFKVHSKLLLIRRKEDGKNVFYSNVSTGNFNESTAKVYADTSLLTSDERTGIEVNQMFQLFEMPYSPPVFRKLIVSPYSMRNHFVRLINTEIKNKKEGKTAWIIIKINNIVDEGMVRKLYQASQAGVKIDILCRGICVLVPGIKGLSENISVRSVVDRYLEHSRLLVFANNNDLRVYMTSADWMVRNLDHRFESASLITDPSLQQEIMDMLKIQMADNCKARLVNDQQVNKYYRNDQAPVRSQEQIYTYLKAKQQPEIE